jgi:hypothetical protein
MPRGNKGRAHMANHAAYEKRTGQLILAGIVVQAFAGLTIGSEQGIAISLIGTGLVMWGCGRYAVSRGRSGWWCLLGILGLIGLIFLIYLKKPRPPQDARGFDVVPLIPSPGTPGEG